MHSESNTNPSHFVAPADYSIHVEGLLDESWSERLAGLNIKTVERKDLMPVTILSGRLMDQAELIGVLNSLYNLGKTLLAIKRLEIL